MKEWLAGAIDEKENNTEGVGGNRHFFVKLIQIIWEEDELLQ